MKDWNNFQKEYHNFLNSLSDKDWEKLSILKVNEDEVEKLNIKYNEEAERLLNEYGPGGAFEIYNILGELINKDTTCK